MSNPQDVGRTPMSTSDAKLDSEGRELSPSKLKLFEVKARLAENDEEIAATLVHLQKLQDRRRDILVDINGLTCPILGLPTELVCAIFLHCLPPARTLPHPRDAPLLLGQVCRRWRTICISFAGLWSSVCVADVLSPTSRDGPLDKLDAWLIRSGDHLLSVSVVLDDSYPVISNGLVARSHSPLYRTMKHTSFRWRELEIVRRLQDFPALLHKDDSWELPQLVKLTLLLANDGRHPSAYPSNLLSNLSDAPALREVHLMGFTPASLLLPWAQLTTVHMENLLPLEILRTLAATTNLIDGTFSLWTMEFFHLPDTAPIVGPTGLESLTIIGEQCTQILDHIEVPSIKKFSLTLGPNNDYIPLVAFFTRSSTLKEVSLDIRGAVPQADLVGCLEALASIETLSFGVHTGLMNGPLAYALQTNASLLPNVRHLTVRECIDRYNERLLDEGVVVEMLTSRWAGGTGILKSFCLVTTHLFHGAVDTGFAALAQEGMDIEIRSHGSGPFLVVYFNSATHSRINGKGRAKAL